MPQQISVFAENKPGKIKRVTEILNKKKINIRAITISDSGDYGIIKLLLDNPLEGYNALVDDGIAATLKDIVAVKIGDSPGDLFKAASILSDNDINVEDAYGFILKNSSSAVFVFQVDNVQHTEKILIEAGYSLLGENELYFI
jgi:hypothetical protein